MKARIIRSAMSFSEFTIDIPAIPRNGDHISIYCKCPHINEGTRDYRQEHIDGCPGTINWYVRSVSFHGSFPEGFAEYKDRETPVKTESITIGVDTRNPHTWPEIYGLPYDPSNENVQRWRKEDLTKWELANEQWRKDNDPEKKTGMYKEL